MVRDCLPNAISTLRAAFKGTPPPASDQIVGEVLQEYHSTQEQFGGKDWDEVVFDEVLSGLTLGSLLSPSAFAYYLPSLLLQTMLRESRSLAINHVSIAFGYDEPTRSARIDSLSDLTDVQLLAIAKSLHCIDQSLLSQDKIVRKKDRRLIIRSARMIRNLAAK